ncbi:Uncharacterized protein HZ326_17689 [Fusarium oxysporum f. sp. albedinis]|nr:Uncharacterized protein HZ326_17689 [Fusarium oxysporum f. sp. albedinis]
MLHIAGKFCSFVLQHLHGIHSSATNPKLESFLRLITINTVIQYSTTRHTPISASTLLVGFIILSTFQITGRTCNTIGRKQKTRHYRRFKPYNIYTRPRTTWCCSRSLETPPTLLTLHR